jgi:hypothetical protein
MKTKLSLTLLLSFIFGLLSSQVPHGFNYQAIARDGSGNPLLSTSLPARITIQADSLGTSVIWQELHSSVQSNAFGLITLVLGKGARQTPSTVANFSDIDWSVTPKFIKAEIYYGGSYKTMGVSRLWSVPYAAVAGDLAGSLKKLAVEGETSGLEEALFEVKNKDGQTIFAVYNEGVRIYVSDGAKAKKGGFAVGGFGTDKAESTKYLFVGKDSVRIYLDTNPLTKGKKSGFAVGGYDLTKGNVQNYLDISPDSVRIYIDDKEGSGKGKKGGFAVGGFDLTKGGNANFLNVEIDSSGVIKPSNNRILWYPLKNAFLTGKVLVESKDSVGENSFSSGFESKSKGKYSQALGFKAIARGDYSTAIGKNAIADDINSFAFGDSARAENLESYAIGRGAVASGYRSFAFGSAGVDKDGYPTDVARAVGAYSFAIGQGSSSVGNGSFSFGIADTAKGELSTAIGYSTSASGQFSSAIGFLAFSKGRYSMAIGTDSKAIGYYSTAVGSASYAKGYSSVALGPTTASGDWSVAMGSNANANGYASTAMGYGTYADGEFSLVTGNGTKALGQYSIAMGRGTTASGTNSATLGSNTTAPSGYETVIGRYNTTYTPVSVTGWELSDRLFVIGNGTSNASRSDAVTILKSGNVGIGTSTPIRTLHASSPTVSNEMIMEVRDGLADYKKWGFVVNGGTGVAQNFSLRILNDAGTASTMDAMTWLSNGNVGIGRVPTTNKLEVEGNASKTTAGSWLANSDYRIKMQIQDIENARETVMKLHPVKFMYNEEWEKRNPSIQDKFYYNFLAQEFREVFPESVQGSGEYLEGQPDEILQLDSYNAQIVAIKALQDVIQENNEQQKQIESQQQQIDELKTLVNRLLYEK